MESRKCCMVGCENAESRGPDGENRAFYVFPTDFNLCMLWVQNSGRPEFFEDFAFAGAQPFLNRHICSEHFKEKDFVNPKDVTAGLLPGAIPNLNFIVPKIEVKEEQVDPEFADTLTDTLISESELLSEIKAEKYENDNCYDVNTNFSFSSNDESCSDLLGVHLPKDLEIYKETEEDKELSNEFFRNYETAVMQTRSSTRRTNESEEERSLRLKREALRAKIRRSQESEEQKRLRRMKNALRAAFRRKNETPEQRALRKRKDMLRAQRRRKAETETEARIRRYNDAVRAAFRRNNETEEQRMERKMKDIVRAAKRRSMETPEQRESRLRKDRERASRRRMLKRIAEQMSRLHGAAGMPPLEAAPLDNGIPMPNLPLLDAVVAQCNDSSTMERLQQVLDLVEGTARWPRSRRRSHEEKSSDSSEDRTALNLSSRPFSSPFREENNRDRFVEKPPQSADNPMHYLSLAMNPDMALCTASDGGGRAAGILNNNGTKTDSSGNYERNEAAEQQAWEPEVVWG